MLDTVSKVVALIVAAVGALTTIFNVFFKGERKRKQAYYDTLLNPFAIAYKIDPNINTIDFVKSKVKRDDDNIPKYVFYLLDTQENDESISPQNTAKSNELLITDDRLQKVLIDDYFSLYPNDLNTKRGLFDAVQKLIDYLMFVFTFLFTIIGSAFITSGAMMLFSIPFSESPVSTADYVDSIIRTFTGLGIAISGLIPLKIAEWLSRDMYTVKRKSIEKQISSKVNRFKKRFDEYVL